MGLFGPSQAEKAGQALASQPIMRDQGFGRHAVGTIPEFDAVVYDALQRSGRDPHTVDTYLLKERLVRIFLTQLEKYCEGSPDLRWDNLLIVMERPDFNLSLLTDYLTTCRGRGIAAHNKLAEFMKTSYPEVLATKIREGAFDLPATSSGESRWRPPSRVPRRGGTPTPPPAEASGGGMVSSGQTTIGRSGAGVALRF
jgi:hypothetical protein